MIHKPKNIDDAGRLQACKELIIAHRAKAGARASYELYGILFGKKVELDRIDHAPTSADFSTMIRKKRIASLFTAYDMVVEFRGNWKTDAEAKVVAWEAADVHA
jgi:hypothetical protein